MQAIRNRSQMEIAFQQLEQHMLFVCPECGETYNTQQQWRQHLNFYHDYLCKTADDFGFVEINDRFHECQICNVMVADGKRAIALLQYHRFLHLPYSRTYRCRHCDASFTRKRILCEHLCRVHERIIGRKVAETIAKNSTTTSTSSKKSLSSSLSLSACNEEKKLKPKAVESRGAGGGGGVQTSSKNVQQKQPPPPPHQQQQVKKQLVAPPPQSSCKSNPEFYMHYICPQCGELIENYRKWMTHIKTEHFDVIRPDCEMQRVSGTKNYYCKICRKVIFSNDNAKLQRHYFMHLPHAVNFHCTYCKIRRSFKTELLHHFIRTHIKEFETHRKYVRKPLEWGAEPNPKLDKELDYLLDPGSSKTKGPNSMKLTSTTVVTSSSSSSSFKQKEEKEEEIASAPAPAAVQTKDFSQKGSTSHQKKEDMDSVGSSSFIDEFIKGISLEISHKNICDEIKDEDYDEKKTVENSVNVAENGTTDFVKTKSNTLEDLCAEIFGTLDTEEENNNNNNFELMTTTATSAATTTLPAAAAEDNSITTHHHYEEQVVKIEINPLDQNELSQLEEEEIDSCCAALSKKRKLNHDDNDDDDDDMKIPVPVPATPPTAPPTKKKSYPTLKSLFSAKILHLCPMCGISFGEQSVWREHVLNAHDNMNKLMQENYKFLDDQDSNLCLNCMQVLATMDRAELQRHLFTHMPYHAYLKCTLCGTSKSNKSRMLRHLEAAHSALLTDGTQNTNKDAKNNAIKDTTTPTTTECSVDGIIKSESVEMNDDDEKPPPQPQSTTASSSQNTEYFYLTKHLLSAQDRLDRMLECCTTALNGGGGGD